MRAMTWIRCGLILGVIMLSIGGRVHAAPLRQDAVWVISAPAEGTTVGGIVTVMGTATLPNFEAYGVLYATGGHPTGDSQWIPIVFGVKNMVVNGALAMWDTTGLPEGLYTLALAMYEVGNTEPKLHFVNNITVHNEPATPTPEPTATPEESSDTEATPSTDATPNGAIPVAPTIQQPPTVTPRPTATPAPGTTPTPSTQDTEMTTLFAPEELKRTFMTGAWLAVALYAAGLLYWLARAVVRYYLRRLRRK